MYQDGQYLAKNPGWHADDSAWKARKISAILEKNGVAPKSVCELGCGAGEILSTLAESASSGSGTLFTGYEISPQAFEICRTKEKSNLQFHLRSLLDEEGRKFDLAMAIDVFEHVEDYFDFLRRFKTKAEYKLFHIPLDLSVQMVLRSKPILQGRSTLGHLHYFTKETALETLKDTGYEIVDHSYTGGSFELSNRGWKANLLKMPRRLLFSIHQDLTVRILGGFSLLVLAR